MRRRLYIRMAAISLAVMLVTMTITAGMFYKLFSDQVLEDLKAHVNILKSTEAVLEYIETEYDPNIDNLRITVVDKDGKVIYESNADIGSMDNHGDRPEIKEAFEKGVGKAIRKSDTLDTNTYYYAETIDNGYVLRVAKEVGSIWKFVMGILPALIVELAISIIVCLSISKMTARKMVEPIELMAQNLDADETLQGYEEIQPFLDKIHSQHKALKKSSNVRQDFTANVSHELKTPLASISGYAELIETGMAKEEDITRFAGEIHKSANRLLALINDIIELSELDVMDHSMESLPINMSQIVEDVVSSLRVNAMQKDIATEITRIDEGCIVEANSQMVEELICNLVDNAIRYNKPGGHVWVSLFNGGSKIILRVKDDGIGISKEDQSRIFERFYRVDKARSKKTGGTGLGLAIVKHIAEQHDAEIVLESELDKGTTISVVFSHK